MQTAGAARSLPKKTAEPNIFFQCEHCNTSLTVGRDAAGMTFNCQQCGKPIIVPKLETPVISPENQIQEIERRQKENESQRVEITGYINQLSIQLHRWQLRLQTLNERKAQLEKELASIRP